MNSLFSEEQILIQDSARKFLRASCPSDLVRRIAESDLGYSPELWQEMSRLGWLGLTLPEAHGGSESGFSEVAILCEELGRACLPSPFIPSVILAGHCLLEAASEARKQSVLPGLVSGKTILTLAIDDVTSSAEPDLSAVASASGDGTYRISGRAMFVPYAHIADFILLPCRPDDPLAPARKTSLFLVDTQSPGLSIRVMSTTQAEKLCEVAFQDLTVRKEQLVGENRDVWPIVRSALRRATIAKCAEMTGGAQAVLDMVKDYACERRQFGRPIGSFQAIQHHCADMLVALNGCRAITYKAARLIDEDMASDAIVACAKAWCNDAYRRIVSLGHQVLGGIGYCVEHDMPLYFRHARGAEVMYGDTAHHLETIESHLFDDPDRFFQMCQGGEEL